MGVYRIWQSLLTDILSNFVRGQGATDATVAELQDQLAAEQAALDFAQGVHPGVINAFKARQRQVSDWDEDH